MHKKPYRMVAMVLATVLVAGVAGAADNIMTNNAGSTDSWNAAGNWSQGHVPTNAENAIVDTGISASVDNAATPVYDGSLTLRENAVLSIRDATAAGRVLGGATNTVTMNNGSRIATIIAQTISQPIHIVGQAVFQTGWSTSGHHQAKTLDGVISGGALEIRGVNNNTINLNATNTFDGLSTSTSAGSNFRIDAEVPGSLGVGDVTIGNTATLRVYADNVMDDSAVLTLTGSRDTKISSTSKLYLEGNDTVYELWVDGVQKNAQDYDSSSGLLDADGVALIGGTGTLTVLNDPPAVPPTLVSIEDDVYGGPIWEDHPYFPISFTVTFDLDMDDTTVSSNDFENGGSAPITIGTVSETFDGVFNVPVTPTGAGTLILQIAAGANLESSVGAALDTTTAIPDDTTITINAGSPPLTTITNTAGGSDSWNEPSNWDNGVPFGNQSAAVAAGLTAQVGGPSRRYEGDLTFGAGATLRVNTGTDRYVLPLAGSTLTTLGNATFLMIDTEGWGSGFIIYADVVLNGGLLINNSGNGSHHETRQFDGTISGSGSISMRSENNNVLRFTATNTFSGGVTISNGNSYVEAASGGAFGTGNVTIGDTSSLKIAGSLSDTISDSATLYLIGAADSGETAKVVLTSDEIVYALYIDGIPMPDGAYDASASWLDGTGILTVKGPPAGTVLIVK